MKNLIYLLFSTFFIFSCNKESIEKPNIILIVADDLGWTDLSYMGSKYYETPNMITFLKVVLHFSMDMHLQRTVLLVEHL